jgi:hypothetical protein
MRCYDRRRQALRRSVEPGLRALVAVVDHVARPALADGHLERIQHQLGAQIWRSRHPKRKIPQAGLRGARPMRPRPTSLAEATRWPLAGGVLKRNASAPLPPSSVSLPPPPSSVSAPLPPRSTPYGLDEVSEGVAEPVQAPDHQGVPVPKVREGLLKARALCAAAAGGVGEGLGAAGLLEGVQLQVECLINR